MSDSPAASPDMITEGMTSLAALRARGPHTAQEPDPGPPSRSPAASGPAVASGRTPHSISLPGPVHELLAHFPYNREDLVLQALQQHRDALHDRRLLRPAFPTQPNHSRRRKITLSTTDETWSQITRLAQRNGWTASSTISTLLWHHLSPDTGQPRGRPAPAR